MNNPPPSPSQPHVEAVVTGSLPVMEAAPAAVPAGPGEATDTELVIRAQGGSTAAFETLVTRYRGRIYAMTMNMISNDADAWDISQDVFIKAWRKLPEFEHRSQFFTWLYRITNNTVIDWIRKKKIQGAEFNDELGNVPAAGAPTTPRIAPAPDRALVNQEIGGRIREALEQLSPEHRAVVLLKEIDGLSYQEIADTVGCALGTVMSRLFNARKRLQEMLRDVYETRQRKD